MDLAALTGQLGGAPQTQGWDAVVAIDATGMNQLLQNWFLGQNPNAPEVVVHTCFTDGDGTGYLLDVMLGAPQLSFAADSPAGSAAATMTRLVVSGQLLIYDPQSYVVSSVLNLTPDCASVTGELALTSTLGSTALGEVVLELGTGAWQASIVGLTDPTLSGALDVAVTSYYQNTATTVPLGGVTTATISPWLQPTTFQLATQPDPNNPGSGCVLLLITTNGTPGHVGPLPSYPIPDGFSAALLVSNRVLFDGLLPSQLSNPSEKLTFTGTSTAGFWVSTITSGAIDVGQLAFDTDLNPYSSTGHINYKFPDTFFYGKASVVVPLDGFTIGPGGATLAALHNISWNQGWAYTGTYQGSEYDPGKLDLSYVAAAPVTITDPSTCVVTFPWQGAPTCTVDMDPSWLHRLFGSVDPGAAVAADLPDKLAGAFHELTLAQVDTFALQNLLFYPDSALALTGGSVPCDLLLTGSLSTALSVSPGYQRIAPGAGAVQFTATLTSGGSPVDLVWVISPPAGGISAAGLYTPPPAVGRPVVVTVSASDGTHIGHAMVLLTPAAPTTGFTVAPPNATLAAAATLALLVEPAQTETLTWACTPAIGTVTPSASGATYTAPATISEVETVTVTATRGSDGAHGSTSITVAPQAALTLSVSATSLTPGQDVTATAAGTLDLDQLSWLAVPATAGTLQPTTGAAVTFTAAAAEPTQPVTVQLFAFATVTDGAGALALASGTVTVHPA